ncbi:BMC domain-containing protein [Bacillaceae bacterium IKA-2]|nr:BMC domain-containing protein [Bacillaceae bacterium IKA-2]
MNQSLGIIEVVGMVTAMACIDAMVKSAYVEVTKIERVGSGFIAIMIEGDLASVQVALEIGAETVQCHGELVAAKVIARPYEGLEKLTAPEKR